MTVAGIKEYFVPEYQRVNNTKIDLYTLERHNSLKKQDLAQSQERMSQERMRQARSRNSNLGHNVDIYC